MIRLFDETTEQKIFVILKKNGWTSEFLKKFDHNLFEVVYYSSVSKSISIEVSETVSSGSKRFVGKHTVSSFDFKDIDMLWFPPNKHNPNKVERAISDTIRKVIKFIFGRK